MTTMKLNHNYILVRPGHHCCVLRQSPDRCCDQEIQLHVINLLLNWLQLTCHDQWSEVFALKIGNDQMWLIVSLISWTWDHVSQACVIHSLCPVKDSIFVVSAPGLCLLRSLQTTPVLHCSLVIVCCLGRCSPVSLLAPVKSQNIGFCSSLLLSALTI